jgi:predicted RND superfamily exporter protein
MANHFSKVVISHPKKFTFLGIALCLSLSIGAANLAYDYSYRAYFTNDHKQLIDFDAIKNKFSDTDNLIFAIKPKQGDVFTQNTLSAINWLTNESWKLPFSIRVNSISNFQHSRGSNDELIIESLFENPTDLTPQEIASGKLITLNEQSLLNRLISKSGEMTAINVLFSFPNKSPFETPELSKKVFELENEFKAKYPNLIIHTAGYTILNNAFVETSMNDMNILFPLMSVIMIGLLFWLLGSWHGAFYTMLMALLSIGPSVGIFIGLGNLLNGTSNAAPMIILTLAFANSIHILVTFQQKFTLSNNKDLSVQESINTNLRPIFLTCLTTAIGFLSLNFSDSPPFRDLGNISALGIIISGILSLTVLPALITISNYKIENREHKWVANFLSWLSDIVVRFKSLLLILMLIMSGILISFIGNNQINDMFKVMFKPDVSFRQAAEFIDANIPGINTLELSVTHKNGLSISNPIFLTDVESMVAWLESNTEIEHVDAIPYLLKRINKNLNNDDQDFYRLAKTQEQAAQHILLYELSLPAGFDVNNMISMDKLSTRVSMSLRSTDSVETILLEERVISYLNSKFPNYEFKISSVSMMFSHISISNTKSMVIASFAALFVISIILLITLKSWKLGLVSLIPNILPALLTFGIWGIFFESFGLAVGCALGMSLGIVVDDTVHFLSRYQTNRVSYSPEESIKRSFNSVGHAMLITTIVLASGFSVLALSSFQLNADVGIFNSITIVAALVCDFFLLSSLLILLDKRNGNKQPNKNNPINDNLIS